MAEQVTLQMFSGTALFQTQNVTNSRISRKNGISYNSSLLTPPVERGKHEELNTSSTGFINVCFNLQEFHLAGRATQLDALRRGHSHADNH
eukprot:587326-Pelagomonas_calceolata.AAC.3